MLKNHREKLLDDLMNDLYELTKDPAIKKEIMERLIKEKIIIYGNNA